MHTYTLTADVTPAPTTTPDDALAIAVATINALTIVEESSARPVGGGIVNLKVTYLGLNDNEARETARRTWNALRQSGGAILATDPVVVHQESTMTEPTTAQSAADAYGSALGCTVHYSVVEGPVGAGGEVASATSTREDRLARHAAEREALAAR